MATFLVPAGLLILLGVLIRFGKWYWLIAGYNTMTKEQKQNVDVEGLARLLGNFLFGLAGLFLLNALLIRLKWVGGAGIITVLIFPAVMLLLVRAQKYDRNTQTPAGTMKANTKVVLSLVAITGIGIMGMMFYSAKPAEVVVKQQALEIKGVYGMTIPLAEITQTTLTDELPKIKWRTNGFSDGKNLKGNFRLEGIGAAKLYVVVDTPPYIHLITKTSNIYINNPEPEKTRAVFRSLQKGRRS